MGGHNSTYTLYLHDFNCLISGIEEVPNVNVSRPHIPLRIKFSVTVSNSQGSVLIRYVSYTMYSKHNSVFSMYM